MLADSVLADLGDLPAVRDGVFGLRLADDPDGCLVNPDSLRLGDVASGWPARAGGLWSRITHSGSDPRSG